MEAIRKADPTALASIINSEVELGDRDTKNAMEHYREAGKMLIQAKKKVPSGMWGDWLAENFVRSHASALRYMDLARKRVARDETMGQAIGRQGTGKVSWQQPIQKIISGVNFEAMARERQAEKEEDEIIQKLASQIIDIGYKALAVKMHPDKPTGSQDAMRRLNEAKKLLKAVL